MGGGEISIATDTARRGLSAPFGDDGLLSLGVRGDNSAYKLDVNDDASTRTRVAKQHVRLSLLDLELIFLGSFAGAGSAAHSSGVIFSGSMLPLRRRRLREIQTSVSAP